MKTYGSIICFQKGHSDHPGKKINLLSYTDGYIIKDSSDLPLYKNMCREAKSKDSLYR